MSAFNVLHFQSGSVTSIDEIERIDGNATGRYKRIIAKILFTNIASF